MNRLDPADPLHDRLDAAIDAVAGPCIVIACLTVAPNQARIVSALDEVGPSEAEACALDLLRTIHARMIQDGGACAGCPTCQARIARIADAIAALTSGTHAPRPGMQH